MNGLCFFLFFFSKRVSLCILVYRLRIRKFCDFGSGKCVHVVGTFVTICTF